MSAGRQENRPACRLLPEANYSGRPRSQTLASELLFMRLLSALTAQTRQGEGTGRGCVEDRAWVKGHRRCGRFRVRGTAPRPEVQIWLPGYFDLQVPGVS